jgi:curli biogenesis system outer membrane secretion channel CsgG
LRNLRFVAVGCAFALAGCATVSTPPKAVDAPVPRVQQAQAQQSQLEPTQKQLKRKIAIARFSNETRYGRTFQTDASNDPLGKQASDILATRLVDSQQFIVLERPDLAKVQAEQSLVQGAQMVGVDALIIGSVTEFGRSTTGKSGFLSSTKIQNAHAKVDVRLVDTRTGQVFFATSGAGDASTESGEIAGYGSRADYDGALNDKAIAAAISDMIGRLVSKLQERQWRTDILKVEGGQVFVAGGARQGLKSGDVLTVYRAGEKVKSAQSGFEVDLPPTAVGSLRVTSLFGDSDTNEGAVCELVSGIANAPGSTLFVAQQGRP